MRFQAKTAILLALTITVLLLATLGVISRQATERVKAELGARLTAIATTASLSLDGDEHEAAAMARSMDDPFYLKIRRQLQQIQRAVKSHDVDNLYTLRRTGKPNLWEFVIDTTETEDMAQPGKPYDVSQLPELRQAFNGPIADTRIYRDEWGEWLSAYAPIHDKQGRAVAVVGVDASADSVRAMQASVIRSFLVVLLIGTVLSYPASFLVARFVAKPLKQLVAATLEVGKGNLDSRVEINSKDELGMLGESFNLMVVGLKERDFVKQTFERYVSREVAEKIMGAPMNSILKGERRHVTVLFTDVRNFTSLSEGMKAEDMLEALNEHFTIMIDVLFELEGTLDKFLGDGLMAVFGAPIVHPNDAERAVRAALEMQRRMTGFNANRSARGLPELPIGIGINSGAAIAGNVGSEKRKEYSVLGDTVNVAARLQAVAAGGEVLLSQTTFEVVKDLVRVEKLPPQTLKGKSGAVDAYRVLGIS